MTTDPGDDFGTAYPVPGTATAPPKKRRGRPRKVLVEIRNTDLDPGYGGSLTDYGIGPNFPPIALQEDGDLAPTTVAVCYFCGAGTERPWEIMASRGWFKKAEFAVQRPIECLECKAVYEVIRVG